MQILKKLSFLLLLLLASSLPGNASVLMPPDTTAVVHRRHSNLRRQLLRADSLRLRMREAADNGKLLLWADSIVEKRIRKGRGSARRREKRLARLAYIDSRLHRGDSLLASNYAKVRFDTAYITRPDARWTVKLRTNISGATLRTESNEGGEWRQTNVHSECRATLSAAVAYRGMALGLAVNPAKLLKKNSDYEFNLNSYSNRYGFDVVYISTGTYHGTQTVGSQECAVTKGQIRQQAVNLNFYYAFSGRRFSYPAAFSQSYVQRRSAGSFMLGASFDGSRTKTEADEASGTHASKLRLAEFAVGAGYAYNFVPSRHWLFHLSSLPTIIVWAHDNMTVDGVRTRMHYKFPSAIITARAAALYSWCNKFLGATAVYNFSVAGDEAHLQVKREKWRVRCFFGFRF